MTGDVPCRDARWLGLPLSDTMFSMFTLAVHLGGLRRGSRRTILSRTSVALAILLSFFHGSCGRQESLPRVNIILVTLDTLRPDRLGCYGHAGAQTPAIDRLAREGVLFTDAFVAVPLTLPSHTTIMTGLPPSVHGMHENATGRLDSSFTTLAELLRSEGYRTGAIVSSFQLERKYGLDQGFDSYDDDLSAEFPVYDKRVLLGPKADIFRFRSRERRAETITSLAADWLRDHPESPFFLWLHYFDPHVIYDPPPPYDRLFPNLGYPHNRYDGEVAYLDRSIGDLRSILEGRGIFENTLLLIVADHGEGLGDHSETYHDQFIYETTVRTALILSGGAVPDEWPSLVTGTARSVDILPTLAEIANVARGDESRHRSLLRMIRGEETGESSQYIESYAPRIHGSSPLFGLRHGRWKYIEAPRPELYDVENDPGETKNLVGSQPERAEELRKMLAEHLPTESPAPVVADRETRERLEAIGYVTAAEPQSDPDTGQDVDPKDVALLDAGLHIAVMHYTKAEYDSALQVIRDLDRVFPGRTILYDNIASLLMIQERWDDVLAEFSEIIGRKPGYANGYLVLGLAHMRRNEDDLAIDRLRRAASLDPRSSRAHYNLAVTLARNGWLDDALAHLAEVTKIEPGSDLARKAESAALRIREAIRQETGR